MDDFLKLIVLIGTLWAVDAVVFGGRYRTAVLQEANYQGETVRYGIRDWF